MSDDFMVSDSEDEEFNEAVQHVQKSHNNYHPQDLLMLYGLYKQATEGNCNIPKPGVFEMKARAKWSAWDNNRNLNQEEAKVLYMKKLKEIDVQYVAEGNMSSKIYKNHSSWAVHSIEAVPTDSEKPEHEKNIFDFVKEGNVNQVKSLLASMQVSNINQLDENGIGLIHWAADRNHYEVLQFLLQAGANVDMQDVDQQTALHYAASVGNVESIQTLLAFNANKMIQDSDGQTCYEVAESSSIANLLK